ncbi:MAG: hypothetical protein RLZZ299_1257 [Pseudomonadota bacterium]
MAERCVVVGTGPSAEWVARAFAARGAPVTLVRPEGLCASSDALEPLVGTGLDEPLEVAGAEAVLGAWVDFEPGLPALALGGRVHGQPLSRRAMLGALSPESWDDVTTAWARARAHAGLTRLVGGGRETRTYADWVARRVGVPMMERVFAPYARKRLGEPGAVSASEARRIHGEGGAWRARAPATGGGAVERVCARVRELGQSGVTTEEGVIEGRVFVDVPPARALAWMPALREAIGAEVRHLECWDAFQVTLVGGDGLPFLTHVLDGDASFYRLVRAGMLPGRDAWAGTVTAQLVVPAEGGGTDADRVARVVEGFRRLGVRVAPEDAVLQRFVGWHPRAVGPHLARARRWVEAAAEAGVQGVGRAGQHASLAPIRVVAHALDVLDGMDALEARRRHVEPPAPVAEEEDVGPVLVRR